MKDALFDTAQFDNSEFDVTGHAEETLHFYKGRLYDWFEKEDTTGFEKWYKNRIVDNYYKPSEGTKTLSFTAVIKLLRRATSTISASISFVFRKTKPLQISIQLLYRKTKILQSNVSLVLRKTSSLLTEISAVYRKTAEIVGSISSVYRKLLSLYSVINLVHRRTASLSAKISLGGEKKLLNISAVIKLLKTKTSVITAKINTAYRKTAQLFAIVKLAFRKIAEIQSEIKLLHRKTKTLTASISLGAHVTKSFTAVIKLVWQKIKTLPAKIQLAYRRTADFSSVIKLKSEYSILTASISLIKTILYSFTTSIKLAYGKLLNAVISLRYGKTIPANISAVYRRTTAIAVGISLVVVVSSDFRNVEASVSEREEYEAIQISLNDTEIETDSHKVRIVLNRKQENDTADIELVPLTDRPYSPQDVNDILIKTADDEIIFEGEFLFDKRNPTYNPTLDKYYIHATSLFAKTKYIIVRNEKFEEWASSEIVKYLAQKYLPQISVSGVQSEDTPLSFEFNGITLYDAFSAITSATGWTLKIGYGRLGEKVLYYQPFYDETEGFLYGYGSDTYITIDDDHFISATPFYYDDEIYNKVRIVGGTKRIEKTMLLVSTGETQYIEIPEEDCRDSDGNFSQPYMITVEVGGNLLKGSISDTTEPSAGDFGNYDWLYCTLSHRIYLKNSPEAGQLINVHYVINDTISITVQDNESISKYGLREHADLVYEWVTTIDTLQLIGQIFLNLFANPQLVGSITVSYDDLPCMVFPGDKIYVDLSRYYTGWMGVDRVIHDINATSNTYKHIIKIEKLKLDAWGLFNKMLKKLREAEERKKKPRTDEVIGDNENRICWRTEIVEITPSTESQEYELKTIFIEQPYLYVGVHIASEDEDGNPIPSVPEWTEIGPVFRLVKEQMTRDEFKNATNTEWNINWDDERDVWQKVEGYCMVDDFTYVDDEGNEHDYSDYVKVILKITGFGALKNA